MRVYKCKCVICKKPLTTDKAFKVAKSDRNEYYCNEVEYNFRIAEMRNREKLMLFIKDEIMNYGCYQILPTVVQKKFDELHKGYSYEIILETCRRLKETLSYWARREDKFDGDYEKASYICSIVINKINDVYKEIEKERKMLFVGDEPISNVDLDIINLDTKPTKPKTRDISDFLD